MKVFGVLKYICIGLNVLSVLAMLICAYSVYLHPVHFPNWSWLGMIFPIPLIINIVFLVFWLFFKRRWMLISIIGMLICAGSIRTFYPINILQDTPNDSSLIVLSYNVEEFNKQSDEEWADNDIVRYLLDSDADIICLQEAGLATQEWFKEIFSEKYQTICCCGSIIDMVVVSRLPIIDTYSLNIPSEGNSSCVFNLLLGTDTLTVINNHLESYKLSADDKEKYKEIFRNIKNHTRKEQIEENFDLLEDKLAAANQIRAIQADTINTFIENCTSKYIICCGDFNDNPISYVHRTMTTHLNDTYTRSGNGMGLSYHKSGMYFRIDNILASDNFTPFYAKVDDEIDRSDHYPIICTLEY